MSEQTDNKEFPYAKGTLFESGDSNNFKGGRIAEATKEELDKNLFLKWAGQQHYKYTSTAKKKKKEQNLLDTTPLEQEAAEKKEFYQHIQVKPNPLAYATAVKVWIYYTIVILGMLAEFFIYQSIFENTFGMVGFKSYFSGLLVVLFTKFVQFAIQKHIKHFIKTSNLLFKSITKTAVFVLVGLVILNAVMLGITNLNQINRTNKIAQLGYLSSAVDEAIEFGEDTEALETELSQLEAELNEEESGFFTFAKLLSIGLIGLLAIACGAVLFAVADLYADVLRLQNKIQKLKDYQAELRANFSYFLTTYDDLVILQQGIIELFGQKHFLETLLSKEREDDLKVHAE